MRVYVVEADGSELDAHYFALNPKNGPDKYGKKEGFKCYPRNENENKHSIYYRSIEDLADHLTANPDWGVRVTMPDGSASLRYRNIFINGHRR